MAPQAPTTVTGQTLLEATTLFLALLLVLAAFEIRGEAGRTCAVPTRPVPERAAAASAEPAPADLFAEALLLGD